MTNDRGNARSKSQKSGRSCPAKGGLGRPLGDWMAAAGPHHSGMNPSDPLGQREYSGGAAGGVASALAASLSAMEAAVAVCAQTLDSLPDSAAHDRGQAEGEEVACKAGHKAAEQAGRAAAREQRPWQAATARTQEQNARVAAESRERAGAKIASDAETGRTDMPPAGEAAIAKREEEALELRKAEAKARLAVREEEERIKREARARRKLEAASQKEAVAEPKTSDLSTLGAAELHALAQDFLSSTPRSEYSESHGAEYSASSMSVPRQSGGRQRRSAALSRRQADIRFQRHAMSQADAHAKSMYGVDWLERAERNLSSSRQRLGM